MTPSATREAEASPLLELIVEQAGSGLCLVAPDGGILLANTEWLRATGLRREQAVGGNLLALFPEIEEFSEALRGRAGASRSVMLPRRRLRRSEGLGWCEARVFPVPMISGTGLLVAARNVTPGADVFPSAAHQPRTAKGERDARERAELLATMADDRLRAVLEQMPAGVIVADAAGKVLAGNEEIERIFRHPILFSREIAEYGQWKGFHPDGRPLAPYDWPLARSLASGEVVSREEVAIERGDGTRGTISISSAPIRDATGVIRGGVVVVWDVTAQKEVEAALRESRGRWKGVFQHAPVPFLEQDFSAVNARFAELRASGVEDLEEHLGEHPDEVRHLADLVRTLEMSRSTLDVFGVAEANDLPRALPAYFDDDSLAVFARELIALWRGDTLFEAEMPIRDLAGERRFVELRLSVLPGHETALSRVLVSFLDVTGRRAAEDALRAAEARYRRFFTHMQESTLICGIIRGPSNQTVDCVVRDANPEAISSLGLRVEDLRGKRLSDLFGTENVARYVEMSRELSANGRGRTVEIHVQSNDKTYLTSYFGIDDETFAIVSIDITDRRRAEDAVKRSEAILAQAEHLAHLGAWWIEISDPDDIGTSPLRCSAEVFRIFGCTSGSIDPTTQQFFEMVHPEDRKRVADALVHTLEDVRPHAIEHRIIRPDGTERIVLQHAEVVRGERGRPLRLVGAILDVTEQKETEALLREANQRKNEFLSLLSHELRNPLAPIRNSLYILGRSEAGSVQCADAIAVIDRQTEHLTRLVDDLLDVTRISRGKIQLHREQVDLAEIVVRTLEDHMELFARSGIALGREIGGPLWVEGDAVRLAQAVGNLLVNAAKFTIRGGRVNVSARREHEAAVVVVRDTGIGIAPDMLGRMFDPFVQGDETLHRTRGGLGLGLALVQGLVEMHGGTVEGRSEGLGHGSEFNVRLPLSNVPPAVRSKRPLASEETPRRRILVLEDNLDAAETLQVMLEMCGHEVDVVHDGASGIERARTFRPDVVLCDIGLPGMNGYEVARAIRSDESLSTTVLIALTGYALPDDQRQAAEAGFDAHVAKPVSAEYLQAVVANVRRTRGPPSRTSE